MGLLSRIEGADFNKVKSASSVLTYYEFVSKHNLEICGIFKKTNSNFFLTNSYGLDIKSIVNSKSTEDFWNGLIEKDNQIYTFRMSDDSIQPVYQFFSFKMRDLIKTVVVYKNKDSIYMICNTTDEQPDYRPAFQDFIYYDTLNFYSPSEKIQNNLCKFTLDFSESISLENDKLIVKNDIFNQCISNQIFNILQSYFPSPSNVEKNNFEYTINFKALTNISENLFLTQIKENFMDFLPNSFDKIQIKNS